MQSLADLADYHNDVTDSVQAFLSDGFGRGDPRFLGYKPSELQNLLGTRRVETELRSSFALLGLIEAAFRIDFRLRVKQRRKDALSRAFRLLRRQSGFRIRFEDILNLWIQHYPSVKRSMTQLRSTLQFRHWLAHGRYWEQPDNGKVDYISIYTLASAIFANFPLVRET